MGILLFVSILFVVVNIVAVAQAIGDMMGGTGSSLK